MCRIYYFHVFVIVFCTVECQPTTDVLWDSCETIICDQRDLHIRCETDSKILINNVTSGLGHAFDEISYLNLRRMCMGMSSCNPNHTGFCKQHKDAQFNVSHTCVKVKNIDNTCDKDGKLLVDKSGFITSPNYPAETSMRSCKWKIPVPPQHHVHVFLHEVLPNSQAKCTENGEGGLRFSTNNNCQNRFPTYPICSESSMDYTISACNTTEIWLPWSSQNMRFWLSYYVVKVPELRHVSLYNRDITCNVYAKEEFTYRSIDKTEITYNNTETFDSGGSNSTTNVEQSLENDDDGVDYVMYIGLAVGILVIIVIVVILVIYLRCRFLNAVESLEKRDNLSNSNSQTNCSEIQKRPLPETQSSSDLDAQDTPVLQQSYSVVADEIPPQKNPVGFSSPTYAEIEEYSETGMKPKLPLVNKRSVDNSRRKLPAKPDEAQTSIYSEIEDAEEKDADTEKTVLSKNKKNQKTNKPDYIYKKKLSDASNIYDECQDVTKLDKDKAYMDMSHKKVDESEYVPHHKFSKDSKDKANQSKKCRVTDRWTNRKILYADCDEKTNGSGKDVGNKLKKESVTSESDSDEDICMVENELYEPFESAKV